MDPAWRVMTPQTLQLVSVCRHGHVNSLNAEIEFHLKCKLRFPCAQFMCYDKSIELTIKNDDLKMIRHFGFERAVIWIS